MHTLLLYYSRLGNTAQIAAALADAFADAGSVELLTFDQLSVASLAKAHLIIAGAPTHRMNLPAPVRAAIAALTDRPQPVGSHLAGQTAPLNASLEALPNALPGTSRRLLQGKPFAAYDTSYRLAPWLAAFSAAPRLARRLQRLGGQLLVQPVSFHVIGRSGPLAHGEIERASSWAGLIIERANAVFGLGYRLSRK